MIVDSSALVAIIWGEAEEAQCVAAIADCNGAVMSAGNYLEASIVIDKDRNPLLSARLDTTLTKLGIEIVAVTAAQAKIARQAYRDFGKGSGHTAKLNFGDCFAYALAKAAGEPLLFKGNDFRHTDINAAVPK